MTLPMFPHEQSEMRSDDYLTPAWVFDAMGITFDLGDDCVEAIGRLGRVR